MADKPKTYAMQVQELKDIIVQKDERINELLQQNSVIQELQQEVVYLRGQVETKSKVDNTVTASNKAQLTDVIQRAESAEQGVRNLQAKIRDLEALKEQLESQLNIMAMEVDKSMGKDKKVVALEDHIKAQNFKIANVQQQLRDLQVETNEHTARMEKEIIYLRDLARVRQNKLVELITAIDEAPDTISKLKSLIRNG